MYRKDCEQRMTTPTSKTDYIWWVSHLVGVALVGVTFGECYIRWVLHLVDVALVGVTFGGCCEIHKLLSDSKVGLKTAYDTASG